MLINSEDLKRRIANKEASISFAPSLDNTDRAKLTMLHQFEKWIEEAEQISTTNSDIQKEDRNDN